MSMKKKHIARCVHGTADERDGIIIGREEKKTTQIREYSQNDAFTVLMSKPFSSVTNFAPHLALSLLIATSVRALESKTMANHNLRRIHYRFKPQQNFMNTHRDVFRCIDLNQVCVYTAFSQYGAEKLRKSFLLTSFFHCTTRKHYFAVFLLSKHIVVTCHKKTMVESHQWRDNDSTIQRKREREKKAAINCRSYLRVNALWVATKHSKHVFNHFKGGFTPCSFSAFILYSEKNCY